MPPCLLLDHRQQLAHIQRARLLGDLTGVLLLQLLGIAQHPGERHLVRADWPIRGGARRGSATSGVSDLMDDSDFEALYAQYVAECERQGVIPAERERARAMMTMFDGIVAAPPEGVGESKRRRARVTRYRRVAF